MTEPFGVTVCPTDGADNLRNSEASIIDLSDGSLLLAYTRFREGSASDFAPADVVTRLSTDMGRTWSEDRVVARGPEGGNAMSASFVRLAGGGIALFYLRGSFIWKDKAKNMDSAKTAVDDLMMRVSHDEGKTWSDERNIGMPGEACYGLLNDTALRLSTGRIILPCAQHFLPYNADHTKRNPSFLQCHLSDDDGETWFPTRLRVCPYDRSVNTRGICESSVVERADGSLLLLSRTIMGFPFRTVSHDGGETWSEPEPTDIVSSASPAILKRVPGSDDIVMIWNQASAEECKWGFARHRLTAAVSSDGGETWHHHRNLESMDDRTFLPPEEGGPVPVVLRVTEEGARREKMMELGLTDTGRRVSEYPSLLFAGDHGVVTFDTALPGHNGCSLEVRVLPISWFYEAD